MMKERSPNIIQMSQQGEETFLLLVVPDLQNYK